MVGFLLPFFKSVDRLFRRPPFYRHQIMRKAYQVYLQPSFAILLARDFLIYCLQFVVDPAMFQETSEQ